MRAIHVSVRAAPIRDALIYGDHGNCAYYSSSLVFINSRTRLVRDHRRSAEDSFVHRRYCVVLHGERTEEEVGCAEFY